MDQSHSDGKNRITTTTLTLHPVHKLLIGFGIFLYGITLILLILFMLAYVDQNRQRRLDRDAQNRELHAEIARVEKQSQINNCAILARFKGGPVLKQLFKDLGCEQLLKEAGSVPGANPVPAPSSTSSSKGTQTGESLPSPRAYSASPMPASITLTPAPRTVSVTRTVTPTPSPTASPTPTSTPLIDTGRTLCTILGVCISQ